MNKTIFAFTITASMFLVSCGTKEENNNNETEQSVEEKQDRNEVVEPTLVGTWQQTDLDMGVETPADEQAMFDKTKRETINHTEYVFGKDGSLKLKTWMLGTIVKYEGTYSVDNGTLITTLDGEDVSFNYTVSDSEFVTTQEYQGAIMKMTFTRK
jgi:outer membrane lipoprotein-sorting protein